MKKGLILLVSTAALVIVFHIQSCGKNQGKLIEYIPKNAELIVELDLKQVATFLNKNKPQLLQIIREKNGKNIEVLEKILENPEKTGLDFSDKMYAYASNIGNGGDPMLLFAIKSKNDFETFITSAAKSNAITNGDISHISYKAVEIYFSSKAAIITTSKDPQDLKPLAENYSGSPFFAKFEEKKFANIVIKNSSLGSEGLSWLSILAPDAENMYFNVTQNEKEITILSKLFDKKGNLAKSELCSTNADLSAYSKSIPYNDNSLLLAALNVNIQKINELAEKNVDAETPIFAFKELLNELDGKVLLSVGKAITEETQSSSSNELESLLKKMLSKRFDMIMHLSTKTKAEKTLETLERKFEINGNEIPLFGRLKGIAEEDHITVCSDGNINAYKGKIGNISLNNKLSLAGEFWQSPVAFFIPDMQKLYVATNSEASGEAKNIKPYSVFITGNITEMKSEAKLKSDGDLLLELIKIFVD